MTKKPHKKRPNWKLMSEKDKAKYIAKHGVRKPKAGRKRSEKPIFMSEKESRQLLRQSYIPRPTYTRAERRKLASEGVKYWASGVAKGNRIVL